MPSRAAFLSFSAPPPLPHHSRSRTNERTHAPPSPRRLLPLLLPTRGKCVVGSILSFLCLCCAVLFCLGPQLLLTGGEFLLCVTAPTVVVVVVVVVFFFFFFLFSFGFSVGAAISSRLSMIVYDSVSLFFPKN